MNNSGADTKLGVPIVRLQETAREFPEVQAEIGWRVLVVARKAGVKTFGDLLKKIEGKEE